MTKALSSGHNLRVETWKEVAAFFNRDERTVKRWEAQRGLPVRRLPGPGRSRIYALVGELEAWRDSARDAEADEEADAVETLQPPPSTETDLGASGGTDRARAWSLALPRLAWIALACAVPAALAFIASNHALVTPQAGLPSLAAQQAYVAATLDWEKRTPESLERAEREYRAAITANPAYAAAYVGLANTYNLLREYAGMSDAQAYPLARENALKAIELDDSLSGAHAALGFAEYWGYWDIPKARAEFARSVALDPRNATAHHWYATFLSNLGEESAALHEIDTAYMIEPRSFSIATDRALIIALNGDPRRGIDTLRKLAALQPRASSPLRLIAGLSLKARAYPTFLEANRGLAAIDGDPARVSAAAADERAYRQSGSAALFARMIANARLAYIKKQGSAFDLALLSSLAGRDNDALALLQTSADRRESAFLQITNPADFHTLRHVVAFQALLARVKPLAS